MSNYLGIDLGIVKSGVCWIADDRMVALTVELSDQLINALNQLAGHYGTPTVTLVDAPIDPQGEAGFRPVDRVFMRGLFNNNHIGLQPNNPDLLKLSPALNFSENG